MAESRDVLLMVFDELKVHFNNHCIEYNENAIESAIVLKVVQGSIASNLHLEIDTKEAAVFLIECARDGALKLKIAEFKLGDPNLIESIVKCLHKFHKIFYNYVDCGFEHKPEWHAHDVAYYNFSHTAHAKYNR